VRVITALGTAAAAGVVIVTSWQAGQRPGPTAVGGVRVIAVPPGPTTSGSSSGPRSGSTAKTGKAGSKAAPTRRTIVGGVAQTRYGDVQVSVTLLGTRIVDVKALHLTDSSQTSVDISAGAEPTLRSEALAAQSANIDLVSGATYTSEGYRASLQAALDAAHR
jgi:uncharacterized protein with FMN-binding domain